MSTIKLTALIFATDVFWLVWYWKHKNPYEVIGANTPWLIKWYLNARFHISYRIARSKHVKFHPKSRVAVLLIALGCIMPMFMVAPMFHVAGIIGPPTAFAETTKVIPFKTASQTVTTYTAAVQALLTASPGAKWLFRAFGGTPYIFNSPITLPLETIIEGENQADTEIVREGNGDLFRVLGDNQIKELYCRAKTKQANGACFDFSHGTPNNVRIYDCVLGNFFFNGFFMVQESAGSFGVIMIRNVHFEEPGTRVKEWGGAAFVMGGKKKEEKRTIGIWLTDIYVGVNLPADMGRAFEIQNTDSLHMKGILVQNAGIGVRFGAEDESPLLTTNTFMVDVHCDGCTKGFFLANLNERHEWSGIVATASAEAGIEHLGIVSGVNIVGGNASVCKNGFRVVSSATKMINSFTGFDFVNNEEAGVLFEASNGGWTFTGGKIGNFELQGGKKQLFGAFIGAKCEHIHFKAVEFVKGPKAGEEQTNYTVGIETVDVDTEAQAKEHGCVFR